MGHGFCEYVTRYPVDRLPQAGGVDATVVVTMTLRPARRASRRRRHRDPRHRRPASPPPWPASSPAKQASSRIVLGGKSEILDQGRAKRFHTKAQRIAIGQRDKTCTADGCDWPAAMCHVHHNQPWSKGGKTTIADGRLLCPRHHTYAHNPKYQMKTIPNGRVVFSRT